MTAPKRSIQSMPARKVRRLPRPAGVSGACQIVSLNAGPVRVAQPGLASTPPDPVTEQFSAELIKTMKQLRRYALWLSKSVTLADDLMQDALLKAWKARDRFEPGSNLNAWCRTILRNEHISQMRRSWRMLPLADETMASLPARNGDFKSSLDLLAVRNGMALLPAKQREALLLIGVGAMSYIEAARLSGCAVGTMKSRVSRARAHLAVLMSENRAGFSSDEDLRAGDVLADLLHQFELIRPRAVTPVGQP